MAKKAGDERKKGYPRSHAGRVRTENTSTEQRIWIRSAHYLDRLRSQSQRSEGIQPLSEQIALLCEGNRLPDRGTEPKELAHLIKENVSELRTQVQSVVV